MSELIKIIEIEPIGKGNYKVLTGFTGPGYIGNTALMYIARSLGFKLNVKISSRIVPPMMLLVDGKPTPALRIYCDKKRNLLFIISEALISMENAWFLGTKLMEWFQGKGVREIISIEGMPFGTLKGENMIFGYSSTGRNLSDFGVRTTKEGAISGLNAVFLEESMKLGMSWISLFVTTPLVTSIDYGGAATVIEVLNRMFKLDVDPTPLRKSEEFRKMMTEQRRKQESRGFLSSLRKRRT